MRLSGDCTKAIQPLFTLGKTSGLTASLFRSSSLVDSSFLRHISHQVFRVASKLANLSAETLVLGLPHDISPFPSLYEVISGFSGTMLLSLSEHMVIIIML